jgi:transposase InsO family protein
MQRRMTQQLVIDALTMALFRRGFPRGTIIHSDRGSQYCSAAYQRLIKTAGLRCSMGCRANCYDNAAMEFGGLALTLIIYHDLNAPARGDAIVYA